MPKKSKFTPEQLAEFARAREEITNVAKSYEGKKARQHDKTIIANHEIVRSRDQNGEWQKKNSEATRNRRPGWNSTISDSAKKTRAVPGWKDSHKESVKKRNEDPEYHIKLKAGIKKRSQDPEWQRKHKEARIKAYKKIMTPDGLFESIKSAVDYYNIKRNSNYSDTWLRQQRKKFPNLYYLVED